MNDKNSGAASAARMGDRVRGPRRSVQRLAAILVLLAPLACSASSETVRAERIQDTPGRLDLTIRDFAYHLRSGFLAVGEPATIVLTNEDSVTHGFQWSLVEREEVTVETEGVTTFTLGFKGLHLNPGETVRISFTPMRTGKFTFKCDIHPDMEGEVFVLQVGQA